VELHFRLKMDDDWPPVALEGVPCSQVPGGYRVEAPPLFVKGLSCGDIISVALAACTNEPNDSGLRLDALSTAANT